MVINIHKTPAMIMEVTGIISGTTGIMKMSMDVTTTDTIRTKEIWGEINMVIHATTNGDLKIIHIGPGPQGTIGCIVMITEINN